MSTVDDILGLLARTAPFSSLPRSERESLAADMLVESYPADAIILESGRTEHVFLYLVLAGRIRLAETSGAARLFGEGKLFGQYGLVRGGALPYRAETLEPTRLALIPVAVFRRLCREHPRMSAFLESDVTAFTRSELTLHDLPSTQLLFGTRLGDLIDREPLTCTTETTVREAACLMERDHADCVLVMSDDGPAGLLTDRALRRGIVATGAPSDTPVGRVMSTELAELGERNSLYEALLVMLERGLSHVLVRSSRSGSILGIVTERAIARGQSHSPVALLDRIGQESDLERLGDLRDEGNELLLQLYGRGVRAQDLITINTLINDNLTGRVLASSAMALEESRPDTAMHWVWLSLGSEGRGEMSLKTDQDNALSYEAPDAGARPRVREWLLEWAAHANRSLDTIGLKVCAAGMMAGNPSWCHPRAGWHAQFHEWMTRARGEDIMRISAACDLRATHGDFALEEPLKAALARAFEENPRFITFMARGVVAERAPLQRFPRRIRTSRTERGRMVNVKRRALQPITDFARILALQHGYRESSNTFERLDYLLETGTGIEDTVRSALQAYRHLTDIRLGHHLQAESIGTPVDDWLPVDRLSDTQQEMLTAAFGAVELVQAVLMRRFRLQPR